MLRVPCHHPCTTAQPLAASLQVELGDSPELVLPPAIIRRGDKDECLIEASINSVRVSLRMFTVRALVTCEGRWQLGLLACLCTALRAPRIVPFGAAA